jgi:hypothetical protein
MDERRFRGNQLNLFALESWMFMNDTLRGMLIVAALPILRYFRDVLREIIDNLSTE